MKLLKWKTDPDRGCEERAIRWSRSTQHTGVSPMKRVSLFRSPDKQDGRQVDEAVLKSVTE